MTAATAPRKIGFMDAQPKQWPLAPSTLIKEGWVVGRYPSGPNQGTITTIDVDPSLVCEGLARHTVDNSANAGPSSAFNVPDCYVDEGIFPLFSTGLDETSEGQPAYGVDNQTFALDSAGGRYPIIGMVWEVTSATQGFVKIGREGIALAKSMLSSKEVMIRRARNVIFTNIASLAAYTVAASSTYNDSASGGNLEGDIVLLVAQTTVAQNGLYRVGVVATGVAPLARVGDVPIGFVLPNGTMVEIAEGSVYGKSTWKATAAGTITVGTNDPVFYPRRYRQTITLASGTYTIGFGSTATPDEPLFLLAGATVQLTRNTHAGTLGTDGYEAPSGSRVTGINGTAVVVVNATNDNGGTGSSDTSTVDVDICNF